MRISGTDLPREHLSAVYAGEEQYTPGATRIIAPSGSGPGHTWQSIGARARRAPALATSTWSSSLSFGAHMPKRAKSSRSTISALGTQPSIAWRCSTRPTALHGKEPYVRRAERTPRKAEKSMITSASIYERYHMGTRAHSPYRIPTKDIPRVHFDGTRTNANQIHTRNARALPMRSCALELRPVIRTI